MTRNKIPGDTKVEKLWRRLEASKVVERLQELLPSNYFTSSTSTHFGSHYEVLAREFALFYNSSHVVIGDASLREATFKLLFRNFGHMLDFYTVIYDTEKYRDFLVKLVELYFGGSTNPSIQDGVEYFSEQVVQIIEPYKLAKDLRMIDFASVLNMPQWLTSASDAYFSEHFTLNRGYGITKEDIRLGRIFTNRDAYKFLVYLFIDQGNKTSPFELIEDVRIFTNILKPAHTVVDIAAVLEEVDGFTVGDLTPHFVVETRLTEDWFKVFDLVLNAPERIWRVDPPREILNSIRDGTFGVSSFMRDELIAFSPDLMNKSEVWFTARDYYPMVRCFENCQQFCEASCEGATCENFCEAALQHCYSCQARCENLCQEFCELHNQVVYAGEDCEVVCQSSDEWGACQAGCETGCEILCEVDCQHSCLDLVQWSCTQYCQIGCEVVHESGCTNVLEDVGVCSLQWQLSIPDRCGASCQVGCEVACESGCLITCELICEIGCEALCQHGCQNTCQTQCEVACQGTCQYQCESGCQESCMVSCQGPCMASCQDSCEMSCQATCMLECQNACQSVCETQCENFFQTCVGVCQGSCQKSCQTSCEQSCEDLCVSTCENFCQQSCQDVCENITQGDVCTISCQTAKERFCNAAILQIPKPVGGLGKP